MSYPYRSSRNRRWIAVLAILALVSGQTAAAAHVCPGVEVVEAAAAVPAPPGSDRLHGAGGSSAWDCPMSIAGPHPDRHRDSVCSAHCDGSATDSRHAKTPEIPALPGNVPWFSGTLPGIVVVPCHRHADGPAPDAGRQRLHEYCRLLN